MTLTKNDLKQIGNIFEGELDNRLGKFKDEILEEMDNKLVKLRSDFYERVDPVLKEVTSAREERTLLENRVEALEDIHQTGTHSLNT